MSKQYTIRSVPDQLDEFLRGQSRLSGKSLNKTVLDYLKQSTKIDLEQSNDNFAWIIGANTMDDKTIRSIQKLKAADKAKQLKQR